MKLKSVKLYKIKFDIRDERFVLFDKFERQMDRSKVRKYVPFYYDAKVLKKQRSIYISSAYCMGYPTLHIKLDIDGGLLLSDQNLKFGEYDKR